MILDDRSLRRLVGVHPDLVAVVKEAAANAAVEKARQLAAAQRAADLAQLEALKAKLGVK